MSMISESSVIFHVSYLSSLIIFWFCAAVLVQCMLNSPHHTAKL